MDVRDNDDLVEHSIVLGFYFLLRLANGCTYEAALRHSIQLGGDTDTNAAIIGGLLGAAVGFDALPKEMCEKVLEFDCSAEELYFVRRKRPEFLSVKKHFESSFAKMLSTMPQDSNVIILK